MSIIENIFDKVKFFPITGDSVNANGKTYYAIPKSGTLKAGAGVVTMGGSMFDMPDDNSSCADLKTLENLPCKIYGSTDTQYIISSLNNGESFKGMYSDGDYKNHDFVLYAGGFATVDRSSIINPSWGG